MPKKNPNKPPKAQKVVIPDEKLQDFATSYTYTIDPSTANAHASITMTQNWAKATGGAIDLGYLEKKMEEAFGVPYDEISVAVGKDNIEKPKTPEDLCKIINELFRLRSDNLHFFFTRYDRYTHRYFCQQYISGLPKFILTACSSKYGWDVALNATWTGHKTETLLSWDQITKYHVPKSLPIAGMMQIPSVRSISCYEWGFEILSHGGYSAFGIMRYALSSDNFCNEMTEFKEWALPIGKQFQLTKPLAKWSELTPEEAAELNRQLECSPQLPSKCNMNVGQRKVQLDITE